MKTWKIALFSAVLYFAIMPVRGWSFRWAVVLHSVAFFLFTWWMLSKYKPSLGGNRIVGALLLPWLLFDGSLHVIIPDSTLFSVPVMLLPVFSILLAAILFYYRRWWIAVAGLVFWLWALLVGFDQWVEWVSYGRQPKIEASLSAYEVDDTTHVVPLGSFQKEYVLFDVWSSTCGVCIRQMPQLQALYDEYQHSPDVTIASLFVYTRQKETVDDGYRIVNERGYHFPVYGTDAKGWVNVECGVNAYPCVLILDRDRHVVFKGSLEFAKKKLKKLLDARQ